MLDYESKKAALLAETDKLHARFELSKTVGPDWYEPGMMEYLDKSEGIWDERSGELMLRFESRGTRYDGRSEAIEDVSRGDRIFVKRDPDNEFNHNNFLLLNAKERDVGNMPAVLCNAIAPLYDAGLLTFESAAVSFVEPITRRSRYARQAVLFVELRCRLAPCPNDDGQSGSTTR